ncbi:MAG: hypothetical protein KBT34_02030 [Prevotella sp.]|nr:hypothetical protein [Candidatus Prevotella equi]
MRDNPRRLWLKRHNPQFFRLRKGVILDSQQGRWECRAMGNMFLLSFPFRQQVQCSRSLSQSEIDARKAVVLRLAAQGYVTISAAISEGEKQIVRAVREAGHPLVILLKDGFPAKDSPHERYYKPSGIYFDACAEGRLLLLEPFDSVYASPAIANAVYRKSPFAPRNSQRYRFLALNTIANALSKEEVRVSVEQHV